MSAADVTLVLEGTYPYVPGGVSSWVHQLLKAYPDRAFSLVHIGPKPGAYTRRAFELPPNVDELRDVYCRGTDHASRTPRRGKLRRFFGPRRRRESRVLSAIRRLHLQDHVDDDLLEDLCAGDLSLQEFLHGDEAFELLHRDLYPRLGPGAPFIDFFWHYRALHVPFLRLLSGEYPEGRLYHAVSTGYAGLVAAVASKKNGRPLLITEHGLYAREREIELARASWIRDAGPSVSEAARPSPLRRFWCHFFRMLSRIAYHQATRIVTLSEANRRRQLADGADPIKIDVVPNGVSRTRCRSELHRATKRAGPLRVGFVGRLVPIKDVVTLIRACGLALAQVDLELWIIGPEDEDPRYARRCHSVVATMGLEERVLFLGRQPMDEIYPKLDLVALTSISEGQPLVILEAFAAGLPVVATDVGACRELIEGVGDADRRLGPAGIVTRVASPPQTADALEYLAGDPEASRAMGRTGLARVTKSYQQEQVVARYNQLYSGLVTL